MAIKRKKTAAAPGGGNGNDSGTPGLDHAETIRIRAIVDTMQEMYNCGGISLGDWWSEIMVNRDDGRTARKLAQRLGVPFMLFTFIDYSASAVTPPELDEWNKWLANGGAKVVPEYTTAGWEED